MSTSIARTVGLALAFAITALSAVPNYPISTDVPVNPISTDIPVKDRVQLNEYLLPNCLAHYTVNEADTCLAIVNMHPNTLSLNQFYLWNPTVQRDCSNLAVGENVCIRARTSQDCGTCGPANTSGRA